MLSGTDVTLCDTGDIEVSGTGDVVVSGTDVTLCDTGDVVVSGTEITQ